MPRAKASKKSKKVTSARRPVGRTRGIAASAIGRPDLVEVETPAVRKLTRGNPAYPSHHEPVVEADVEALGVETERTGRAPRRSRR